MKVLIIGYGSIGKRHFEVLSKFSEVTCVNTISTQKLKDIQNLDFYDYFIISNATYKHFDTLKFVDDKVKNKIILVEKPLFKDYTKYKIKNKVFVAYNLRFHPIINYLKNKKIIYFNAIVGQDLQQWRSKDYQQCYSSSKTQGGGVLRDLSHEIDYIQYLNGKIKNIKATIGKQSTLNIDTEDIVVANGKTKKAIFSFSLDYISDIPFRQIIAYTKDKTYICDLINNTINGKKLKNINKNYTYTKLHKAIFKKKFNQLCSYKEGLQTMKIIKRIENA